MTHDTNPTQRHVLLVEDHLELALMMKDDLQDSGFNVTLVRSPEDAIEEFSGLSATDAVVTDITFQSQLDGFYIAQKVRALFPDIQVIGMSGRDYSDGSRDTSCMTTILLKPFAPDQLVALLTDASRT